MNKIRKAIAAGVAAGGAVLITGLKTEIPQTQDGWAALIGGAIVTGVLAGITIWRIPNAQ